MDSAGSAPGGSGWGGGSWWETHGLLAASAAVHLSSRALRHPESGVHHSSSSAVLGLRSQTPVNTSSWLLPGQGHGRKACLLHLRPAEEVQSRNPGPSDREPLRPRCLPGAGTVGGDPCWLHPLLGTLYGPQSPLVTGSQQGTTSLPLAACHRGAYDAGLWAPLHCGCACEQCPQHQLCQSRLAPTRLPFPAPTFPRRASCSRAPRSAV